MNVKQKEGCILVHLNDVTGWLQTVIMSRAEQYVVSNWEEWSQDSNHFHKPVQSQYTCKVFIIYFCCLFSNCREVQSASDAAPEAGVVSPPLDSAWAESTRKKALLKLEKLDTDLKNYKGNSIKESIRYDCSCWVLYWKTFLFLFRCSAFSVLFYFFTVRGYGPVWDVRGTT